MDFLFPLLLLLLFLPLFLSFRKQRRQMAEMQALQNSLAVGDRVMTTSGLYATVVGLDDDTIDLEVAPGVTSTWVRQAVREKVSETTAAAPEDTVDGDAKADEAVDENADKR
ncbi:MAG TPA: preprotein translocase subunit YajC [Pseudonocardiaceae bacterium]